MNFFKIFSILALLVLVTPVLAQSDVDQVILSSNSNYPDSVVSSSVSDKLGIPVLLTSRNELPEETQTALQDFNPKEVVVVGGPSVISQDVIDALENDYNVTRTWGATGHGTASELAGQFWPENTEQAVLVEDASEDSEVLGLAKNLANDKPMLPIPKGKIPSMVLSKLDELGVEEVKLIATEVSQEIEDDLNSLGIQIQEQVQAGNEEQLKDKLKSRITEDLEANNSLVVVASSNFKHVISAPNLPQSKSFIVSSENEIEEAVNAVNERGIEQVKVVGKPDLAETIADEIESQTDASVNLVVFEDSGAVKTMANLTREGRPEFAQKFGRKFSQWKGRVKNSEQIRQKANRTLDKAKGLLDDFDSDELNESFQEAKEMIRQGNYQQAFNKASQIGEKARNQRWQNIENNRTAIREEINQEVQTLKERVQAMKEVNQEFGEQMQQNMSTEERLQIIEQFRARRRNTVREIVGHAAQMGRSNGVGEWMDQAEQKQTRQKNDINRTEPIPPENQDQR